jgi:UDPglucose 6-dehydrogenase
LPCKPAIRESPAISIAQGLIEEKAQVVVSDPEALEYKKDRKDLRARFIYEPDPYRAAEGAHAIAILTEWDLYKTLDYKRIFDSMVQPSFLFDGRNILDHKKLFNMGFNVFAIGKAPLKHF